MLTSPTQGVIALDIDGTVTTFPNELHSRVVDALGKLAKEGWKIIFITGRPFQWCEETLKVLPFPYLLAVQNGALLLEMPSREVIIRKYLDFEFLSAIENIALTHKTDFVIYSGMENGDLCYFRPASFPSTMLQYGLKRAATLGERWEAIHTFSDLPITTFASFKFFADEERALSLSKAIERDGGLHAPPNRDPYNGNLFVVQATHAEANKGDILKALMRKNGWRCPVIAAGDDYNDVSMLRVAKIKIVMENAPLEVLALGDVIAPSAEKYGIIQGLEEGIHRLKDIEHKETL